MLIHLWSLSFTLCWCSAVPTLLSLLQEEKWEAEEAGQTDILKSSTEVRRQILRS